MAAVVADCSLCSAACICAREDFRTAGGLRSLLCSKLLHWDNNSSQHHRFCIRICCHPCCFRPDMCWSGTYMAAVACLQHSMTTSQILWQLAWVAIRSFAALSK